MATENKNEIAEVILKMETDYRQGNVTISEYVNFDMYATINTIEAYLNSKHTSGQYDSLGREKPFFNVVVSASNIWYRATDIDRKNIRIKAKKDKDLYDAFLMTVHLQDWMTREKFGQYLNEWGRVLSRYGSAVTKVIEKEGRLTCTVIPWNRLIVDPIDFESNPKIEILELTEAQLRKNKSYDADMVEALCSAKKDRETIDKRRKDNRSEYIKLYEIHGEFPLSYLTGKEKDKDEYVQQMHVVSFVSSRKQGSRKNEIDTFTLFVSREEKDPYRIAHLIKEDGRTLSIGAVEHLFQTQWMTNHTTKAIKDQLDLASKLVFQTSDPTFVNQNALQAIENGDILIHGINQPLTQLQNNSHDITALQSFHAQWKSLGNEIVGISESMLGVAPKSGTAWRQTEAMLQESYSLFELMTENKGLYLEDLLREEVMPHIKKRKLNTKEQISATLEANDIDKIDSKYIKNFARKTAKKIIRDKLLEGETVTPEDQAMMIGELEMGMSNALNELDNQRFFSLGEMDAKTWKEQFKDIETDLEVDITGEAVDYQSALSTLNTALQVILNPGYAQNKQAQMIVSEILRTAGHISPLKLANARPANPALNPTQATQLSSPNPVQVGT